MITAALTDFGDRMRDGADSQELNAGLLALDFLLRKSELDDFQAMRYGALQDEAQMRMMLMSQQQEMLSEEETRERIHRYLTRLTREISHLSQRMKDEGVRFLMAYQSQHTLSTDGDLNSDFFDGDEEDDCDDSAH